MTSCPFFPVRRQEFSSARKFLETLTRTCLKNYHYSNKMINNNILFSVPLQLHVQKTFFHSPFLAAYLMLILAARKAKSKN